MKFVDEVTIDIYAGRGGDGCLSFRREKFIPRGGPNGGNGGVGGSVYLITDPNINTLIDLLHIKTHRAENGQGGQGNQCTGRDGQDCIIPVPVGTLVYDADTEELLGDLTEIGQKLLVAKGGGYGLGNMHFKSSINRAPRRITKGHPGENRRLHLELKVLADVGLLGLPNAGKSTLISQISAARPKIAAYPFTTLHPYLGVVKVDLGASFVVADIPGLIEGAAHGAGLGIAFLKHLARTCILCHVVDLLPQDNSDPVNNVEIVNRELATYSENLANKPQILVLNKIDLIPFDDRDTFCQEIIDKLQWQGPIYVVSGVTGEGLKALTQELYKLINLQKREQEDAPEQSSI